MQKKLRSPGFCLLTLAVVVLLFSLARAADDHGFHVNATGSAMQLNISSNGTGNHEEPPPDGPQDFACPLSTCWDLPESAATNDVVPGARFRWAFHNNDVRFGQLPAPPDQPPRFQS